MRPLALGLFLCFSLPVLAADLEVTLERQPDLVRFRGVIRNQGMDAASDARVRFTNPSQHHWDLVAPMPGWACTSTRGSIECARDSFPAGEQSSFTLYLRGTGNIGGRHYLIANTSAANDINPSNNRVEREYILGNGWSIGDTAVTLPNAIAAANAVCLDPEVPCSIVFYFHPELLQQQLYLNQALPVITACNLTILAPPRPSNFFPRQSWAIFGEASNRAGLIVSPQCDGAKIVIDGLWLGGFAHDAIAVVGPRQAKVEVVRSFIIGGSRGIAVHAPATEVSVIDTTITNTNRSAITLWSSAHALLDDVILRDSGASGVFVGPESNGDVKINGSEISGHRHFGVALARTNVTTSIETTVILKNAAGDIDWGLDGPDSNDPADIVPDTPRVRSARYDSVRNVTRIEVEPGGPLPSRLEVWASPHVTMFGAAHLQSFVAATPTASTDVAVFEHPGDLRGRYVSALRKEAAAGDRTRERISEVSFGVRVQ